MNSQTSYIRAGWLIDGTGNTIQKDVLLTVKHGRITAICSSLRDDQPDSSLIVDFSHCTLIPPLVDCHVHLALSPVQDQQMRKKQLNTPFGQRKAGIKKHLSLLLRHGVVAVRDGGDQHGHACLYKSQVAEGKKPPHFPQLKVTSSGLYAKGCYGAALGKAVPERSFLSEAASQTVPPMDHVKLFNSGVNSLSQFGKESASQFTLEEITALTSSLEEKKLPLMVHANGTQPVANAVEGGCRSIEHGFFMGEENLQRMADLQTFWVPTACTMKTLQHLQVGDSNVTMQTLDSQLEQLAKARQYGVPVAIGTDAGSVGIEFGVSVTEEIQLLEEAGYSLAEAIECATTKGADLLNIELSSPLIKTKPASFLAVKGSPRQLLSRLSSITAIQLPGKPLFFPEHTEV